MISTLLPVMPLITSPGLGLRHRHVSVAAMTAMLLQGFEFTDDSIAPKTQQPPPYRLSCFPCRRPVLRDTAGIKGDAFTE
jgi:hypothetical protein